jgi:hypothetical protein
MEELSRLKEAHQLIDVTQLNGPSRGWVVRVANSAKRENLQRDIWNSLRNALGEQFKVIPALGDPKVGYRYPTGYLSLRFEDGATVRELRQVARQHNLKFVRREEFTQKEALFEPGGTDVFLPALREQLAKDDTIDDVWLETESVYQKE